MSKKAGDTVDLIVDSQCPVCSAYARNAAARDAKCQTNIRDARGSDPVVQEAMARGFNLDDGMVVFSAGKFYHGADAMHFMAKNGQASGAMRVLNAIFFSRRNLSQLLYPALRIGRNLLLKLRGVSSIAGERAAGQMMDKGDHISHTSRGEY
jgi:hypothetical protein